LLGKRIEGAQAPESSEQEHRREHGPKRSHHQTRGPKWHHFSEGHDCGGAGAEQGGKADAGADQDQRRTHGDGLGLYGHLGTGEGELLAHEHAGLPGEGVEELSDGRLSARRLHHAPTGLPPPLLPSAWPSLAG